MTNQPPDRNGNNRLLITLASLFFLAWLVAVFFAVRDTFFKERDRADLPGSLATLALPDNGKGRFPILDRAGRELAVSFLSKSVYARPLEVEHPDAAALFLARELGLPEAELKRDLKEERSFSWLGHQVSDAAVNNITARKLRGIYVVDESQRFYPQGSLAAQLIGFAREGHGLTGIEAQFDGQLQATVDIPDEVGPPRGPLVLTLDLRMQELLVTELAQLVTETGASGGEGIVLDPRSGEVLALANQPSYDANFFSDYDEHSRADRALSLMLPLSGFRSLFRLAGTEQAEPVVVGGEVGGSENPPPPPKAPQKASKKGGKKGGAKESAGPKPMRLAEFAGGYRSRGLAALEKLPEPPGFSTFLAELGFGQKVVFGLPVGVSAAAAVGEKTPSLRGSGGELLTALARVVNPEGGVAPRVVAGVVDSRTGALQPQPGSEGAALAAIAAGPQVWEYLNRLTSEPTGTIYLEELTEVAKPAPEETGAESESPAEAGKGPSGADLPGRENPGGAEVNPGGPVNPLSVQAPGDKAKPGEKGTGPEEPKPAELKHYVSVLLALPGGSPAPEVVLLLVLEGAALDPAAPSPLRLVTDRIMPQLRAWAAEDSTPVARVSWAANEPLWRAQWQKAQAGREAKTRVVPRSKQRRMPDLHGSSLRRALQILNPYGLKVRVRGVGRVTEQRPAAGEVITGSETVLFLSGLNLIDERPARQLTVGLESGSDKLNILSSVTNPPAVSRGGD